MRRGGGHHAFTLNAPVLERVAPAHAVGLDEVERAAVHARGLTSRRRRVAVRDDAAVVVQHLFRQALVHQRRVGLAQVVAQAAVGLFATAVAVVQLLVLHREARAAVGVGDGAAVDSAVAAGARPRGNGDARARVVVGVVVDRHGQRHVALVAAGLHRRLEVRVFTHRVAVVLADEVVAARAVAATQRSRRVAAQLERLQEVRRDLQARVAVVVDGRADVRAQQRAVVALEARVVRLALHQLVDVLFEDAALHLREAVLLHRRRAAEQVEVQLTQAALKRDGRAGLRARGFISRSDVRAE